MTNYSSIRYASSGSGGTTVYTDMNALIAATGTDGAQAFVQSNNNIYVYAGTGWYKIATVQNDSPSAITGVNGTYSLAVDGTPTVITAVSTDPEGFPLTWSYSTSGLGSMATVSQSDNVFTITPSTTEADAGTFTLTINATDGVNGAVSTNTSITLQFQILNSNYTTLLATAVDTSDNSSFTDSSTNALTLSPINAPTSSSFSPYRSGGYSTYFDGNGDYLQNNDGTGAGEVGSGAFCIEAWVYKESNGSFDSICSLGTAANSYQFEAGNGGNLVQWETNNGAVLTSTTTLNLNQWYHVAVSRDSSNNIRLYVDGTKEDQTTNTEDYRDAGPFEIARNRGATQEYHGYIRDLRIVVGDPVYTADTITVPTGPLTAITNTNLLACHLPYIADGSTNNWALNVNGNNVSTKPSSPYDYLEYSATDHGGSVYFATSGSTGTSGGSGQYVQSALSSELTLDTNDFTIDCWVYGISKARNYPRVLQIGPQNTPWVSSQLSILYKHNDDNDSICLAMQGIGGNAMLIASGPIYDNVWYHVAVTRSGSTFTMYINGESVGTYTSTGSATGTGDKAILIGSSSAGDSDFNGYISDLRVFNGTVVYTGNFTPPTEPVSSSAAAVHVIGTDASIIDNSQSTNLKLVGNTTGSTTQVKFADTKSMYFDGTGDKVSWYPSLPFDDDDFTIEFWWWPEDTGKQAIFFGTAGTDHSIAISYSMPSTGQTMNLWASSNGTSWNLINADAGGNGIGSETVTQNAWNHIAVTRQGTAFKLFTNGVLDISVTASGAIADYGGGTYPAQIGQWWQAGTNITDLHGYIQDFRITNGLARYTANFTPPTEPLKG
jgi:hypothetical protein